MHFVRLDSQEFLYLFTTVKVRKHKRFSIQTGYCSKMIRKKNRKKEKQQQSNQE